MKFPFLCLILFLSSCDAALRMPYAVHNKTSWEIKILAPNIYAKDTVLIIGAGEKSIISVTGDIGFPWGTKNIYKKKPGICGLVLINEGFRRELKCDKQNWVYKNGQSVLEIKPAKYFGK